jgi:Fe-S cluster assembly iron-binding protein IscA
LPFPNLAGGKQAAVPAAERTEETCMLQLTDHASDAIRQLLDQQPSLPDDAGLRIVRTDSGRGDLSLFRSQAPHEGDEVIGHSGARVFLDAGAADLLDDKILDAKVQPDGQVRFLVSTNA